MIVDNFIKDKNLLIEIANDSDFFSKSKNNKQKAKKTLNYNHDPRHGYTHSYMFWDGWWRSPANTIKKKVIQKIWEDNLDWPLEDIVGFEYWSKTYMPEQYMDPHVDEDSYLYNQNKIFQGPISGSIYYGTDNDDGGFLEIHKHFFVDGDKESLEKENVINHLSKDEDKERIAYKGNRLIIFDQGHQIHSTTPCKSGVREVFINSVWHKDTPPSGLNNNYYLYE